MPRSLRTCTIRSDPGRTAARALPPVGGRTEPASRSSWVGDGAGACAAAPAGGAAAGALPCGEAVASVDGTVAIAAAPAAALAAPFRNPRRFTASFLDFTVGSPRARAQDLRMKDSQL